MARRTSSWEHRAPAVLTRMVGYSWPSSIALSGRTLYFERAYGPAPVRGGASRRAGWIRGAEPGAFPARVVDGAVRTRQRSAQRMRGIGFGRSGAGQLSQRRHLRDDGY